jgi:ARG/rhodanese/phosphatase superfamily protein
MFAALLDKVSLGIPSAYRNLTLTPILLKDEPLSAMETMSLEEAIAEGTIQLTEVSAEGHVPELRVKNSRDKPILILDGEELVGAKQNRIVNVTILVAPQSEIVIPVSCIEAGRWNYSRPGFAAAGRVLNPEIRYRKAEAVTKNLKERRMRSADQGAVWDGVRKALYALGAASPTSALGDGFDSRANDIKGFVETLKPEPDQIGVIYRIGGMLAGLDLFGSKHAFAQAYAKLVRGSALQVLAGFKTEVNVPLEDRQFLGVVLSAPGDRFRAVGLEEELRYDTSEIGGGALELDGNLIHLFAFPQRSGAKSDRARPRR